MNHYKRLKRDLVVKGNLIDLYQDTIELDDGKITQFDYIHHRGASAMIPVDQDGKIYMVRQYRNAVEESSLEIPAGCINPGEDYKSCAIRECQEETGYIAQTVEHLIDIYTTVAFCNEKISIYYGKDLIPAVQNLDEDEFITIEKYTLEELVDMILSGKIKDAKTISGILAYKTKLGL